MIDDRRDLRRTTANFTRHVKDQDRAKDGKAQSDSITSKLRSVGQYPGSERAVSSSLRLPALLPHQELPEQRLLLLGRRRVAGRLRLLIEEHVERLAQIAVGR